MTGVPEDISLDLGALCAAYDGGNLTPTAVVDLVLRRIADQGDDGVWISRVPDEQVRERAKELEGLEEEARQRLPLYGIPFSVKDCIDVANMQTTAACPAFAYTAERSATVVERLLAAGSILIGKTNLDQFQSGLVGTRTPYGIARNPFDARYIPGGSSSGSGVCVSIGLVTFALGTDVAGSGRVPAAFNNLIGLKPTRGMISATNCVPAARSLDCVSIFSLTAEDALAILRVAAAPDPLYPFSRAAPLGEPRVRDQFRFAVPGSEELEFFGNAEWQAIYEEGVERLRAMGGEKVEIEFAPFREVSELLYGGPLIAERLVGIRAFVAEHSDAMHPVTRQIMEGCAQHLGVDVFAALHHLHELQVRTLKTWEVADFLFLPTTGTIYTIDEVAADPIQLNANLGIFTNFVNLLDLCAIAVPAGFDSVGLPVGTTLIAPGFNEMLLIDIGGEFHRRAGVPMGASQRPLPGLT
ncbi:MAG: allophanate hydrolase [Alphaproteobacteria bacterium]|nr:allophanate hydrolase [Alphaproteobacteria bacterium]